jgi:hypothetical protein
VLDQWAAVSRSSFTDAVDRLAAALAELGK